jgi:signal transduction histidine kinase
MAYPSESDDLAYQLFQQIQLSTNNEQMLLSLAETLAEAWSLSGLLWIVGGSGSDCQIIRWKDKTTIFLPRPIVQGIMTQGIIQDLQSVTGEQANTQPETVVLTEIDPQQNFRLTNTLPIVTGLAIATQLQGEINGLLIIASDRPYDWTEAEKARLQNIALPFAIAAGLWSSRKLMEVTADPMPENWSLPNFTRNFPSQSSPIIRKLYALMRQQFEQQRQLNKLKDDIINTISHEARTPLTTMRMAVSMLRCTQGDPTTQTRYLDILDQEYNRLNDLIASIVTFKMLESQELSYNPVALDVLGLIEELGESVRTEWHADRKKQLDLIIHKDTSLEPFKIEKTLIIESDLQHLRSILSELLDNARKFSAPQSTVKVAITVPQTHILQLTISNQGYPIEPEDIDHIFEPFRRGKGMTARAIAGTGIGLALVKGLVELLQGQIAVTCNASEDSDWARIAFRVALPFNPPQS